MPALAGAFTGASGNIMQDWLTDGHTVFPTPPGGTTKIIPAGATKPQLGIDRPASTRMPVP
jgi:hypothetical protein